MYDDRHFGRATCKFNSYLLKGHGQDVMQLTLTEQQSFITKFTA